MMETLTRLWRRAPQPAVLQLAREPGQRLAASALPQARRRLCREIRRKVPVADAALDKIVRLTGEFIVQSDDALVEEELCRFCREIAIGARTAGTAGLSGTVPEQPAHRRHRCGGDDPRRRWHGVGGSAALSRRIPGGAPGRKRRGAAVLCRPGRSARGGGALARADPLHPAGPRCRRGMGTFGTGGAGSGEPGLGTDPALHRPEL